MSMKRLILINLFLSVSFFGGSCNPHWSIAIQSKDNELFLDKEVIDEYQDLKNEGCICKGLPLEIALNRYGFNSIKNIEILDFEKKIHTYSWKSIADETCITDEGIIAIGDEFIHSDLISVNQSQFNDIKNSLLDIFPTVLTALDMEFDDRGYKKPLVDYKTDYVVLIFLDGLNYDHFNNAIEDGLLTVFEKAEYSAPVLSVYPPRTTVASAAIISGKNPLENGVDKEGIRQTSEKTLFEYGIENGYSVVSVEGESTPFFLGGSEIVLSGDRDSNGSTDDNVYANVISIIEKEVPNLFYIHFHGIDDLGHSYGPDSEEVREKIKEINIYLDEIIQRLPDNSMVITFADHGMHEVNEEKDRGNHGNLIDEDMVVFINIMMK